jgi:large subunit ribosomal protein L22
MASTKHIAPDAYRAVHKHVRMSPRKARFVMDMIRGRDVEDAQMLLRFTKKRAAYFIDRVLKSAVANADQSGTVDVDRLFVEQAHVGDGRVLKRWRPGAQGRAKPIQKRTCHLEVVVRERQEEEE